MEEKQYKLLFEANPFPLWVYDLDTLSFLAVNDAAVKQYQYSKKEFLSMTIKDIRPREDIPNLIKNLSLRQESFKTTRKRFIKKDGTIVDVEVNSHPVSFNDKECKLVLAKDITAQKLAEESVKEASERYRNTLDHLMEGCQIIGFNYEYLYINPIAAQQGKKTLKEYIGHTMVEIYPGIESTEMFSHLSSCMEKRKHYRIQNEFTFPDGSKGWFNLNMEPVPEGVFILSEDITQEKLMSEELKKHREHLEQLVEERTSQLEAANKELEAFSYSVSHDLRAPLRHITGFIQLLQKDIGSSLNEKNLKYLGYIMDSAKKMGLLIDDLLTFSRMGRIEMNPDRVNLNDMVKKVIEELNSETKDRKIEWVIHDLPVVLCDGSMLHQVYVNLIANAVKFTRKKENATIEVGIKSERGRNVFYVRDNGVGFDTKYIDKLFGVFQRLHSESEFEGTGIGLANVKRIIHRHGGQVWAEGAENQGATFYFSLNHHGDNKND